MKEIRLASGAVALVSDCDFESVSRYSWWLNTKGYAVSGMGRPNGISPARMHRFILQAPDGMDVDHIDGDKLNNTRENIRIATRAENARNRGLGRDNTSGIKGVSWSARHKRWRASIRVNGKSINLGNFRTLEEAASAYKEASLLHHGEFGRTG